MSVPILLTKLFIPPARPELVSRSRLIEQLNRNLHRKLTLISAPAGFGKTTLVTDWLHSQGDDASSPFFVGWISLDEGDNDTVRFLTYLITALNRSQGLETEIGVGALQMAQSPQPPPLETILIAMINEIAVITDKIVLILDDYHLIDTQKVHGCLNFLIENLPPQLHLVITTREDPPIQISRLRARGQLNELRALDLRFVGEETAVFLNQVMGLKLLAADISALETRTEGWITGLQMAAISMQGSKDVAGFIKSFAGSHRYVLDYLIEEVLEQQTEEIQTFLMQTAVLDRLIDSLCDSVTGQENGRETLEMLERANLFIIPLDNERRWYRYHHLFADLLRQRLRQTKLEHEPTLHHQASQWYEQNGLTDEAIEHALQSENIERAASLIEDHVDVVWERGEHTEIWRWISGLPVDVILSKPQLCIFQAWKQFANGQQSAAEESLQAAEKALVTRIDMAAETTAKTDERSQDFDRMKIRGRAASIQAHLAFYRGDIEETKRYSRQALEFLPKRDKSWRLDTTVSLGDAYSVSGDLSSAYRVRSATLEACQVEGSTYIALVASVRLAMTMRMQGKLDEVLEICQRQLKALEDSGLSQIAILSVMLAIWGETLAEKSDLDVALQRVREGEVLASREKDVGNIGWCYLCLMRVLFSKGDYVGAQKYINKMNEVFNELLVPNWISYRMADWQVRIWLAQDRLDAADQWVSDRGLAIDGEFTYLNERQYIALARILVAQERLDKAMRLLQRLLKAQELSGHMTKTIQILILQALTYHDQDSTDLAVATLEKALALSESRGYFRIFVDEGPPMASLLYEALSKGITPDYVQRLLAAFPVEQSKQIQPIQAQSRESEWIEPLSDREIEVLRLVAEGLSRQEIAAQLVLSLNTVKTHARNIYSKLGVHSQMQAVGKARALGLLENE